MREIKIGKTFCRRLQVKQARGCSSRYFFLSRDPKIRLFSATFVFDELKGLSIEIRVLGNKTKPGYDYDLLVFRDDKWLSSEEVRKKIYEILGNDEEAWDHLCGAHPKIHFIYHAKKQ